MKLSFGDLIVPGLLVAALGWWGYNHWSERAEKAHVEQIQQAEAAEYQRAIGAMVTRYTATPALTDKLATAGHVLTYNVQNALLAATGRAVIVHASIVDIEKRGEAYVLHLDDAGSGSVTIRYILECDAATGQKAIGLHASAPGVALAAIITGVEKAEFENTAAKAGDPSPGPSRFVAKGRCLELMAR